MFMLFCAETYNDRPDMFDEEQLYVVLKLENAGKDLESFEFTSAYQSYSAFLQVSHSLFAFSLLLFLFFSLLKLQFVVALI